MSLISTLAIAAVAFGFGIYIQRIDQRVKAIKNQLGRLSLTFLKIENDLGAIQDSLLVISRGGDEAVREIEWIRDSRQKRLMHAVDEGPSVAEIMRGLEPPDIDDDPVFWAEDRLKKFGFSDAASKNL